MWGYEGKYTMRYFDPQLNNELENMFAKFENNKDINFKLGFENKIWNVDFKNMQIVTKNRSISIYQTPCDCYHFDCKRCFPIKKCEDCGNKARTYRSPACADCFYNGQWCCYKYVCCDGCIISCSKKHKNKVKHDNGELVPAYCNECTEKLEYKWEGLSLDVFKKRYGNLIEPY